MFLKLVFAGLFLFSSTTAAFESFPQADSGGTNSGGSDKSGGTQGGSGGNPPNKK